MLIVHVILAGLGAGAAPGPGVPEGVWVREGFELTLAAEIRGKARFMAVGDDGVLYVSDPNAGVVRSLRDADGDGAYERQDTFVEGRRTVHGLAWHEGWLWFTQTGSITRARDVDADGTADDERVIVPEGSVPSGGGHWWRSICIHDGRLYTSIGDSGNITDEADTERQKVWSFDLRGGGKRLFCSGIRNTEKLVVRPGTGELWGMDHGSDWFGRELGEAPNNQPVTDRQPPDEMNRYVQDGFYGHPFVVGDRLPRYEHMERDDIVELAARTIAPEWETGAHWAPNAMCFYPPDPPEPPEGAGAAFPQEFRGDAFVAYHGSWNRSAPAGYQVTRVLFEDGHPYGELPMVKFLSPGGEVLGRPVDVAVDRDGSLLISEDGQDRVYRLRATRE